jgi:hypothetical protein
MVERMVVNPTVIVMVAESLDREERRENSLQRKNTEEKEAGFYDFWTGFSSCSGHEIHPYL